MKMVQEQRLQLKMKFLLGYNMKIVILWGDIFLVEEDYPRNVRMKEFQCLQLIKALEISKLLRVCFCSSQLN